MTSKKTVTPKPKKVKRKPAQKPTFLKPEDKRQLLEAINKAKEICSDSLEFGAPRTDDSHIAQNLLNQIAIKLGYKRVGYYHNFTL